MRINSKLFVLVLAVFTVALCAVMLLLWKRLSRRSTGAVLGRIVLVLGSQLAMTATILAAVNIYFGFYTSWQDLLGGGAQDFELKVRPLPEAAAADAAQIAAGAATASGPLAFHGLRSGISANLVIQAPPGYGDPAQAGAQYSVIVVDNTGPAGSGGPAITAAQAQQTLDPQDSQDPQNPRAVPALVVYVDTAGGPAIPCTNVSGSAGGQGALFWDQDLRSALSARFRTRPDPSAWAVIGGGANAACAGTLAVLSSGYYSTAATIGPWTQPSASPQDPPAQATSPGRWLSLYPGPPSDILLVDPDQATKSIFAANPGALRVDIRSGLSAREVFDWVSQSVNRPGPSR